MNLKSSSQLKAFTITELLVVMIIASTLMAAATLIYQNVVKYQLRLQQRMEVVNSFNRLEYLINHDMQRFPDIALVDNTLVSRQGQLTYDFFADSVIRYQHGISEMFPLNAQPIQDSLYFWISAEIYSQAVTFKVRRKSSFTDRFNSNSSNTDKQ